MISQQLGIESGQQPRIDYLAVNRTFLHLIPISFAVIYSKETGRIECPVCMEIILLDQLRVLWPCCHAVSQQIIADDIARSILTPSSLYCSSVSAVVRGPSPVTLARLPSRPHPPYGLIVLFPMVITIERPPGPFPVNPPLSSPGVKDTPISEASGKIVTGKPTGMSKRKGRCRRSESGPESWNRRHTGLSTGLTRSPIFLRSIRSSGRGTICYTRKPGQSTSVKANALSLICVRLFEQVLLVVIVTHRAVHFGHGIIDGITNPKIESKFGFPLLVDTSRSFPDPSCSGQPELGCCDMAERSGR